MTVTARFRVTYKARSLLPSDLILIKTQKKQNTQPGMFPVLILKTERLRPREASRREPGLRLWGEEMRKASEEATLSLAGE